MTGEAERRDRALPRAGSSPARPWVFATTVAFLSAAAALRSVLAFEGQQRFLVLALLMVWLALVLTEPFVTRARAWSFFVYLAAQSAVVGLLLVQSDSSDFFAVLLAVPTMQAMERWKTRDVAVLICAFAVLTGVGLVEEYGVAAALALVAFYAAANVFFAAYTAAARRALEARASNEALAADLRETNRRLTEHAEQAARLGAARERQRLARDLHDSVTQTLFSMTLTAQSASLVLPRARGEAAALLDEIDDLARGALEELSVLSAESPPPVLGVGSLVEALERHRTERRLRDGLEVALEVDGDEELPAEVEQALGRIAQEGLNNVVKHAGVREAVVRLRLCRPYRLEIEDHGCGFDAAGEGGVGLGLIGMRERAAEIAWSLRVESSPGGGSRVVAEQTGEGAAGQTDGVAGRAAEGPQGDEAVEGALDERGSDRD